MPLSRECFHFLIQTCTSTLYKVVLSLGMEAGPRFVLAEGFSNVVLRTGTMALLHVFHTSLCTSRSDGRLTVMACVCATRATNHTMVASATLAGSRYGCFLVLTQRTLIVWSSLEIMVRAIQDRDNLSCHLY